MSSYTPSRPAPSPSTNGGLPPHHPFAGYYVPPFYPYHARTPNNEQLNTSTTSLSTSHTPSTISHSQSPRSINSQYTFSSSSHRSQTKTRTALSSLAAPLSPRPSVNRRPRYESLRTPLSPSPSSTPLPLPLPTELSLFDHRPRQSLLSDLELILGKKLNFPFLARFTKEKGRSRKSVSLESSAGCEKTRRSSDGSHRSDKSGRRVLRKERERSWDEDFAWDGVCLVPDNAQASRGRGVREGNWI